MINDYYCCKIHSVHLTLKVTRNSCIPLYASYFYLTPDTTVNLNHETGEKQLILILIQTLASVCDSEELK